MYNKTGLINKTTHYNYNNRPGGAKNIKYNQNRFEFHQDLNIHFKGILVNG